MPRLHLRLVLLAIVVASMAMAGTAARPAPDVALAAPCQGSFDCDGNDDTGILYDNSVGADSLTSLWYFLTDSVITPDPSDQDVTTQQVWESAAGSWDWSKSKPFGGDFNGDGRSDVGVLYDAGGGQTALWYFVSNATITPDPTVDDVTTYRVWLSSAGEWDWNKSQVFGGDFNGDGIDDVGILYDQSTGSGAQTGLWYFLTNAAITPDPNDEDVVAYQVWLSALGDWDWEKSKPFDSDFDGDGQDDVGILNDTGSQTSLWYFLTNATITPDPAIQDVTTNRVWLSSAGAWDWSKSKLVGGDFDASGEDDTGILYDSGSESSLWFFLTHNTITADPNDTDVTINKAWGSSNWIWSQSKPFGGDFNGSNEDDIGILYNSGPQIGLWYFLTNGSINPDPTIDDVAPSRVWLSAIDGWAWTKSKVIPDDADLDGDGRIDALDNCLQVANNDQANFDNDSQGDACDVDDDNDGFTDVAEASIGTVSLDPCGGNAWPADIVSSGPSANKLDLIDMGSFVAPPPRRLGTSLNDPGFSVRWDLIPGGIGKSINLQDIASLAPGNVASTARPPMFGGQPAFGKTCPFPP